MKIYTYEGAPNARRLAMFMQYKGIEIETVPIDMTTGEQLSPEYRAINPACTVPALVLDDGTVFDAVIGMCTYLESLYPERPLLGTTPLEKAEVAGWCHKLYTGLFNAIASVLRNSSKGFVNRGLPGPLDLPQIPELADRGRLQIAHYLPELDAHLAERPWVAGDNFTFADIDLLAAVDFLRWVKESVPEECGHLANWAERARAELG